ncbi:hypothetical protein [Aquimarina algiphila]|uniref:hypothetical protein n=1 Tax=Aquimarina algiphila TaxID=2047982 RepID=UPI001431A46A|nr:hypothetical protein [Aquimarina algiphila]
MKKLVLLSTVLSLLIFSASCEQQEITDYDENIEVLQVDLSDVQRPGTRETQSVDLSTVERPGTRNGG